MNKNDVYWIWLQQVLGYGSCKIKDIVYQFKDAENFHELGYNVWRDSGIFSNNRLEKLKNYDFSKADRIIRECEKLGQDIISFEHPDYPEVLKNISNPPCVIYTKGSLRGVNNILSIAVVGTRSATEDSIKIAAEFSFDLANAGAIIVSGGALGIDSAAHKGALQAEGKTICVLGCGLDVNYPRENASMRYKIIENGCLISEYPPGEPPNGWHFPVRNRIISGLASGVLIVQAAKRSGALITANLALEQNRDVFVVPGMIRGELYQGSNKLIKDGAKAVTESQDIIEEYSGKYIINNDVPKSNFNNAKSINVDDVKDTEKPTIKENDINKKLIDNLSENAKKIYGKLDFKQKHIDEISILTNLPVNLVLQSITELELLGLINSYSGRKYSK